MKIKEYTTELDADKKNVLREVGHYVIVKEKYNSPQRRGSVCYDPQSSVRR